MKILINSLDETNAIKIWDLNKNILISSLNQKSKYQNLKQLALADGGQKLLVREEGGICVWPLNNCYLNRKLDFSLEDSKIFFLEDGKHILVSKGWEKVLQIEILSMHIKKEITLPDNVVNIFFLPNGSLILYIEEERDHQNSGDDEDSTDEDYSKDQFSQSAEINEHKMMLLNWETSRDARMTSRQNLSSGPEEQDLQELFRHNNAFSSVKIISNLGVGSFSDSKQKFPVRVNTDLVITESDVPENSIFLFVGTSQQECYKISIELDQSGIVYDSSEVEVFPTSHSRSPRRIDDKIKSNKIPKSIFNTEENSLEEMSTLVDKPEPIHDFAEFLDIGCSYQIYCQENEESAEQEAHLKLYYGNVKFDPLIVSLESKNTLSQNMFFNLKRLTEQFKKKKPSKIKAIMYNSKKIILFKILLKSKKFN